MNSKKRLSIIITALMCVAAMFITSCKNTFISEKATIKISVNDETRTVLPDVNVADLKNFKLFVTEIKDTNQLGTWKDLTELSAAEISLEPGNYTFILTAEKAETDFISSITSEIKAGTNSLSFALSISSYGEGTGDVEITLVIPTAKELVKAKYEFVNANDISDYYTAEIGEQTVKNGKSYIPMTVKTVKAGTYKAKVYYYIDTDTYVLYSTVVKVSSGLTSKGTYECEAVVYDPEEWPEYLDLRFYDELEEEITEEEAASRGILVDALMNLTGSYFKKMHASYIGDATKVTTKPVTNETYLTAIQAGDAFGLTQAEKDSIFKFEPVREGVKITFTMPQTVLDNADWSDGKYKVISVMYMDGYIPEDDYFGSEEYALATHHMSTTQNVIISQTDTTKSWIFPLLNPSAATPKVGFIMQLNIAGTMYQTLYTTYYGGGLGGMKNLPNNYADYVIASLKNKNYAVLKNIDGNYGFAAENTYAPESTDKITVLNPRSRIRCFSTNYNDQYYKKDAQGNALYEWRAELTAPSANNQFQKTVTFKDDFNFLSAEFDDSYLWMEMTYVYNVQGYEGEFISPGVSTPITANTQYFNKPVSQRNCPDKIDITKQIINGNYIMGTALENFKDYALVIKTTHTASAGDEYFGLAYGNGSNPLHYYYTSNAFTDTKRILIGDIYNTIENSAIYCTNGGDYTVEISLSKESADVATVTFGNIEKESMLLCVGADISNNLPQYSSDSGKFINGWYTNSNYTQSFDGVVTGDTTLYAAQSNILSIMSDVSSIDENGNRFLSLLNYYELFGNDDKYVCFTAIKRDTSAWGAVSVDFHEPKICEMPSGTFGKKFSEIIAIETNNLGEGQEPWTDPHWHAYELCFQNFDGSKYDLENAYLSNILTVNFSTGLSTEPAAINAFYGENISEKLPRVTKENAFLIGWYTDESLETEFNGIVQENTTLYAKWDTRATLAYNKMEDVEHDYYSYNFEQLESYTFGTIHFVVKNIATEEKDFTFNVLYKPISLSHFTLAADETGTFTFNTSDFTDEMKTDDNHIGLRVNANVPFELVDAYISIEE